MSRFVTIILFILTTLLMGCKTQEQIAKDQMFDNIAIQLVENQKITADSVVRLNQLEEHFGKITGQVEESGHNNRVHTERVMLSIASRISIIEERQKSLESSAADNKLQLIKQSKFISEVLSTLKKMQKSARRPKKVNKKKRSAYDQAMINYRSKKYTTAKKQLLSLLSNKKVKGNKKARVLHNLGMISYIKKNDKDALIYFSKLITKYGKAPFTKNGMLYLAKSFARLKQKSEAKNTLNELISRYPKSKQSVDAKKMLTKL